MTDSAKLAIAGLISVALRRKLNRVIDVEWMLHNPEYSREVLRIARSQNLAELTQYADRMEELILGKVVAVKVPPLTKDAKNKLADHSNVEDDVNIEKQYIGMLR
jgi:hypothetical protein